MSAITKPCAQCAAAERVPKSAYCRECKNERWKAWWHAKGKHQPVAVERKRANRGLGYLGDTEDSLRSALAYLMSGGQV